MRNCYILVSVPMTIFFSFSKHGCAIFGTQSDEDDNSFLRQHSILDDGFIDGAHVALMELPILNHVRNADVSLMDVPIQNDIEVDNEDIQQHCRSSEEQSCTFEDEI